MESRSVPFEMRSSDDGRTLSGYAAVFNSPTRIHERGREFDEKIAPGAFENAIKARDKIVMQFDHGKDPAIGGMPIGVLTDMREDDHGLYVEARLSDHIIGDIVATAIADQAITGMSFRFSIPEDGDTWDRSGAIPERTIRSLFLYELGPVVFPAYSATTVGVRSLLHSLSDDQRHQVLDEFSSAPEDGATMQETARPEDGKRTRSQRLALMRLAHIPEGD